MNVQVAPCLNLDATGVGKSAALQRHAIGDKRIDASMSRADGFMADDATRVMTEMVLKPGGGESDSVEQLAWVPDMWKEQSVTPEVLRTIGAPWLLSYDTAGSRMDFTQWPVPGFDQCIVLVRARMRHPSYGSLGTWR